MAGRDGSRAPFVVRNMKESDISGVLRVWTETGLVEGTHTIHVWFAIDPEGFFIAVHEETGEILGTCVGVILPNGLGFIGLYAVLKLYRKQGIGSCVFGAAMKRLGDRNVGLNAVLQRLPTYRDLAGYKVVSPWASILYGGAKLTLENLLVQVEGVQILSYSADILSKVADFDATVYGYRRDHILEIALREKNSFTVVALRKSSGEVCGFGKAKENVQPTALVGPVYADDDKIAELIYRRLAEDYPLARKEGMSLLSITTNPESMIVAEKLGLTQQMVFPRCYTRQAVEAADYKKIYAHQALNFAEF